MWFCTSKATLTKSLEFLESLVGNGFERRRRSEKRIWCKSLSSSNNLLTCCVEAKIIRNCEDLLILKTETRKRLKLRLWGCWHRADWANLSSTASATTMLQVTPRSMKSSSPQRSVSLLKVAQLSSLCTFLSLDRTSNISFRKIFA